MKKVTIIISWNIRGDKKTGEKGGSEEANQEPEGKSSYVPRDENFQRY